MSNNLLERLKGVLLIRPAISSRNLTSLALVALFFGVYIASGGKVSYLPKVETGSSFGGVKGYDTRERVAPEPVREPVKRQQPVARQTTPEEELRERRRKYEELEEPSYPRSDDGLSDIERRLKGVR